MDLKRETAAGTASKAHRPRCTRQVQPFRTIHRYRVRHPDGPGQRSEARVVAADASGLAAPVPIGNGQPHAGYGMPPDHAPAAEDQGARGQLQRALIAVGPKAAGQRCAGSPSFGGAQVAVAH
jgi:hypothetical protein